MSGYAPFSATAVVILVRAGLARAGGRLVGELDADGVRGGAERERGEGVEDYMRGRPPPPVGLIDRILGRFVHRSHLGRTKARCEQQWTKQARRMTRGEHAGDARR